MSASRPGEKPKISERSSEIKATNRRRRREEGRSPWLLASIALHGLAVVVLLYFTPLRELVRPTFERTRPQRTMSASELEDLAAAIEGRTTEDIRRNTRQLRRILTEIGQIERDMGERFATFAAEQHTRAPRDALREMGRALEQMNVATERIADPERSIESADRSQALAEQAQRRARQKLEMAGPEYADALAVHRRAEQAHRQAKSAQVAARDASARLARQSSLLEAAQEEAAGSEQRLTKLRNAPDPKERDIQREADRLSDRQSRVETLHEETQEARAALHTGRAAAVESQRTAAEIQDRARRLLQAAIEQAGPEAEQSAPPGPSRTDDTSDMPTERDLRAMDASNLYTTSRQIEDHIAERFKEVRAMDLAMVRDIELADARDDIDVIRPVRPDLDESLLREAVRTDTRFTAHKEELKKALRETDSMVNLAGRMLEMATRSVADMRFGTNVPMAGLELQEEQEFELRIRELAMEDVSGRFADMSEMMREPEGSEARDEEQPPHTGSGQMQTVDYRDLTAEELAQLRGSPAFGQEGDRAGDLPQLTRDVQAVGARKLSRGGQGARWWYVDTWHTLGPFPNPNRVNIDREFPPDSLIDLDATYVGKDGRTIRWQFVQSDQPEVIPYNAEPYGIWYAYTELYFDQARDMLVALGSDDRGILKINGVPVWISSKRLKGWDIDEVWRRVHFRQGVNRVLYRVENGWLHVGFSMVLRVPEE